MKRILARWTRTPAVYRIEHRLLPPSPCGGRPQWTDWETPLSVLGRRPYLPDFDTAEEAQAWLRSHGAERQSAQAHLRLLVEYRIIDPAGDVVATAAAEPAPACTRCGEPHLPTRFSRTTSSAFIGALLLITVGAFYWSGGWTGPMWALIVAVAVCVGGGDAVGRLVRARRLPLQVLGLVLGSVYPLALFAAAGYGAWQGATLVPAMNAAMAAFVLWVVSANWRGARRERRRKASTTTSAAAGT